MPLGILFPNGKVEAVLNYIWDINTLQPILWDGSLTVGSVVIGSVTVTGNVSLNPLPAGTNVIGHVIVDSSPPVSLTNDGTFATPALQITGNASLSSIDGKLTNPLPVSVSNFPVTQPVSLAVAPSTPITNTNLDSSLSGILAELQQKTEPANQQHVIIDSSSSIAVTGPLTDTQLRLTPVPVSGTVSVDTSLLSTSAKQDTGNASLASILAALSSALTVIATNLDIRDLVFATDKVDVSGSSISATVDTSLLATSAKQDSAQVSLTSIAAEDFATETSLQEILDSPIQGLVNDTTPYYLDNQVKSVSLTGNGKIRIDIEKELEWNFPSSFDGPDIWESVSPF